MALKKGKYELNDASNVYINEVLTLTNTRNAWKENPNPIIQWNTKTKKKMKKKYPTLEPGTSGYPNVMKQLDEWKANEPRKPKVKFYYDDHISHVDYEGRDFEQLLKILSDIDHFKHIILKVAKHIQNNTL